MINTDSLKEWVDKNKIEKRSIERFWEYIKMYTEEVEDEYSNTLKYCELKYIKVKLYKVSLSTIYNNGDVINVFLDLTYLNNYIGRFEIVYTLSAEYKDEFLELEDTHFIWRLTDVFNKTLEVAKNAIRQGAEVDFVAKITGLEKKQIIELKE